MLCREINTNNINSLKIELDDTLKKLKLSKDCIITKVNWGNREKGYFSDYDILELYFASLKSTYPDAKLILLESYSYERNDPMLIHYPPNYYKKRLNIIRENEKNFIIENKFDLLFKKFNIEYINITEEFIQKKIINSKIIKKLIVEKYNTKVVHKELLKMVPLKLQAYIGCSLVSFTKIKGWFSETSNFYTASMKNLFGLIPIPCRRCYHGKGDKGLGSAICDINLIYRALFNETGIVEAVFNTKLFIKEKPIVVENLLCIAIGNDLTYLDSAVIKSFHGNPFIHNYIQCLYKHFPISGEIITFPRIEKKFEKYLNQFSEY